MPVPRHRPRPHDQRVSLPAQNGVLRAADVAIYARAAGAGVRGMFAVLGKVLHAYWAWASVPSFSASVYEWGVCGGEGG